MHVSLEKKGQVDTYPYTNTSTLILVINTGKNANMSIQLVYLLGSPPWVQSNRIGQLG